MYAGLIVEVFGDDASGDNRAALMSSGELRPLKDHRRVNAGEEREAPGIGWESSKSKGASALKIRCSVYIGYFEISNRVDTLILNQGLYGGSLRPRRNDNASMRRGDFRLGTRRGGAR